MGTENPLEIKAKGRGSAAIKEVSQGCKSFAREERPNLAGDRADTTTMEESPGRGEA